MPAMVTLIHGLGCDSSFWWPEVANLASQRWLLRTPDLPFHGGPTEGVLPSLSGMAGWLAQRLQGQASVLIGHSLGGMIALQIAHEAPALAQGLVLVDAFPDLQLNSRYLPGMFVEGADDEVRQWVEQRREEIVRGMSQETYDTIWPSVRDFNAVPWLPKIRCPVLGIYGGRGRYRSGDHEMLRQQLKLDHLARRAKVVIIPGGGHFVQLEYPREVNAVIAQWLKEHYGAPVI